MASWPTSAILQVRYGDLLNIPTARLDYFVSAGKYRVQHVMMNRYDVSLWIGSAVPPQATEWSTRLAHAYFQQDVHFGASPESGIGPATTVRNQVEEEMKAVLNGGHLVDDNGNPILINPGPSHPSSGVRTILLRTTKKIFDLAEPRERQRVLTPDPQMSIGTSRWR